MTAATGLPFGLVCRKLLRRTKIFALQIMAGDQIYADRIVDAVRKEKDERKRQELYLGVYRDFWSDLNYRRILCRMPAVMMWDDHDINDVGAPTRSRFASKGGFKPEYLNMFQAAKSAFSVMQASRNPDPLFPDESSFDTCFRIGNAGFIIADLRSNRNLKQKQMWAPEQLEKIKGWVDSNRNSLEVVFFVSTVVFSHGAPNIDSNAVKMWPAIIECFHSLRIRNRIF